MLVAGAGKDNNIFIKNGFLKVIYSEPTFVTRHELYLRHYGSCTAFNFLLFLLLLFSICFIAVPSMFYVLAFVILLTQATLAN